MGHVGIIPFYRLIDFTRNHGIHEKTAGIPLYLRVRKLGLAYGNHHTAQILRRDLLRTNTLGTQSLTYPPIIQVRAKRGRQPEMHVRHRVTSAPLFLKDTFPISVTACRNIEHPDFAVL